MRQILISAEKLAEVKAETATLYECATRLNSIRDLDEKTSNRLKILIKRAGPPRLKGVSPERVEVILAELRKLTQELKARSRALPTAKNPGTMIQSALAQMPEPTGAEIYMDTVDAGRDRRAEEFAQRLMVARLQVTRGITAREAVEEAGLLGVRTARWARKQRQRYEEGGRRAMALEDRRQENGRARGVMTDTVRGIIMALQNDRQKAGPRAVTRKVEEFLCQRGLIVPSESSVKEFLRSLPPVNLALLRGEDDIVRKEFNPVVRGNKAEYGSHRWQVDHKLMDVWIASEQDGKRIPMTPWITLFIDEYSRAVMGYHLSVATPDTEAVALALSHALNLKNDPQWFEGLPAVIQTDRGTDFVGQAMREICMVAGVELVHTPPKCPHANGIVERVFLTLKTYLMASPGNRDAHCRSRAAATKQLHRLWTLPELKVALDGWVQVYNHETRHGETKEIPSERWKQNSVPRSVDASVMARLLYPRRTDSRMVQNDGVTMPPSEGGKRYQSADLGMYVKRLVTLTYSPDDLDSVAVHCDATGEFLCVAWAEGTSGYPDKEKLRVVRSQSRRTLAAQLDAYLKAVREFDRPKAKRDIAAAISEVEGLPDTPAISDPSSVTVIDDSDDLAAEFLRQLRAGK